MGILKGLITPGGLRNHGEYPIRSSWEEARDMQLVQCSSPLHKLLQYGALVTPHGRPSATNNYITFYRLSRHK